MVLQNTMLSEGKDKYEKLFLKTSDKIEIREDGAVIPAGVKVTSDTYMGVFDIGAWKKYTAVSDIFFEARMGGKGKLCLFWENGQRKKKIGEICYNNAGGGMGGQKIYKQMIPGGLHTGIIYFELAAEKESVLKNAFYKTEREKEREIKLSLIICTYKRKEQLDRILCVLKRDFFAKDKKSWLRVRIVDNASELAASSVKDIVVYHNSNTGGSGGFSRGIDETIRDLPEFNATHAVFMDDDVIVQSESLYRLYALLSFIKEQYEDEVVAGRMFRMDQPWVQYTAAEIWNRGELLHVGFNRDMTDREYLWNMNDNRRAEYGGWWFAAYPIGFVKRNRPLPFFIHCDDVEYGLRHGGTPVILNGIQVWHETYEYRQTPVIAYYDMRNSLIVNARYGLLPECEALLSEWKKRISGPHVKKDYLTERMLIQGLADFGFGPGKLRREDISKKHLKLLKKKKCFKYMNSIYWRLTKIWILVRYKKVSQAYKE